MAIRVTLTGILDDFWGADDAYADGGAARVRELIQEDIQALMENLSLKVEKVEWPGANPGIDEGKPDGP